MSLGINIFADDPWLLDALRADLMVWIAMADLPAPVSPVHALKALEAIQAGTRHETLAKRYLADGLPAEWATDMAMGLVCWMQGHLSMLRQRRTRITEYRWRTVGDGRVRPECRAKDGKRIRWDSLPDHGHPGELWKCRCWPEAFIPLFEDLDDIPIGGSPP